VPKPAEKAAKKAAAAERAAAVGKQFDKLMESIGKLEGDLLREGFSSPSG